MFAFMSRLTAITFLEYVFAFMSRLTAVVLLAATMFVGSSPAHAADRASPDEAKAFALKAAAFLKTNLADPQKAFTAFNADPAWLDRDLYVTVRDKEGTSMAHPKQPAMIGRNHINLKDVDGKPFVQEYLACTSECWVHYKWKNHATGAIEQKSAYVVAVGDYRVLVGAYKP